MEYTDDQSFAWYNYDTEEYVYLACLPTDDADILPLLPAIPAARSLYTLYRETGMPMLEAMAKVLEMCVPAVSLLTEPDTR